MSTEETRSIAHQWMNLVQAGRYDKLDTLATPNANWWVGGLREQIPAAGDMPYKRRQKQLDQLFGKARSYTTDLLGETTENNISVLEVMRKATGPGDKTYENAAIVKLTVKDGKIEKIEEWADFFALYKYMAVPWLYNNCPTIAKFLVDTQMRIARII